jgi:TolB-like protein
MIRVLVAIFLAWIFARSVLAEPTVLVLPFDPLLDSTYTYYGGKESILDYRNAIQQMLITELSKHEEIWVVEPSRLKAIVQESGNTPEHWNHPALAAQFAASANADYAIIGTYGEFTQEIRVDARVVIAATGEVPPANNVTATAKIWDDLPTAVSKIAEQLIPIITASGSLRPTSKGYLYPEGGLVAYDPNRTAAAGSSRLVVWINAPAPVVSADGSATFARCDRIDLMNIPRDYQRNHACRMAILPAGSVHLRITHRGYLPFEDVLSLAPEKAYRYEVNLQPIETQIPR